MAKDETIMGLWCCKTMATFDWNNLNTFNCTRTKLPFFIRKKNVLHFCGELLRKFQVCPESPRV